MLDECVLKVLNLWLIPSYHVLLHLLSSLGDLLVNLFLQLSGHFLMNLVSELLLNLVEEFAGEVVLSLGIQSLFGESYLNLLVILQLSTNRLSEHCLNLLFISLAQLTALLTVVIEWGRTTSHVLAECVLVLKLS
jgi:hypothetical protein